MKWFAYCSQQVEVFLVRSLKIGWIEAVKAVLDKIQVVPDSELESCYGNSGKGEKPLRPYHEKLDDYYYAVPDLERDSTIRINESDAQKIWDAVLQNIKRISAKALQLVVGFEPFADFEFPEHVIQWITAPKFEAIREILGKHKSAPATLNPGLMEFN